MGDKKHIDRLFQENFKDFEVSPNDEVWSQIEAKLNQKKKKRRVIPIWWRYAGIAALLLLFITAGNIYFDRNTNPSHQVVDTEKTDSKVTTSEKSEAFENIKNTTDAISNNKDVQGQIEDANQKNEEPLLDISASNDVSIAETSSSVNDKSRTSNSSSNKILKTNKTSIGTKKSHVIAGTTDELNNNIQLSNNSQNNLIIAQEAKKHRTSLIDTEKVEHAIKNIQETKITISEFSETTSETNDNNDPNANVEDKKHTLTIEETLDKNKDAITQEKPLNRWRIAPNAAPVYFNTLGDGSSIDSQFNSNSKTGEVNMSYGITASYAINEKLSVRSGINRVNLGYNTNNVIVFQSVGLGSSTNSLKNVNSGNNSGGDNVSIISGENINSSAIPDSFESYNTSINQAFGYVEIPLEGQYTITNKKLGINVIGGFSSLFLSNNKLYSEAENGSRTFLGEANNINKMSYSANFGLGLNYKVSKKLDLNLEPMFKYQINTFNNTSGDFKPYFIGVYTGFAIKF